MTTNGRMTTNDSLKYPKYEKFKHYCIDILDFISSMSCQY